MQRRAQNQTAKRTIAVANIDATKPAAGFSTNTATCGASLPAPGQHSPEAEILTSRAADNLFWTGRYLERAEAVTRLLRAVLDGLWEEETAPGLEPVLHALMRLMGYAPGDCGCKDRDDLATCVRELTTQNERPGNLAHTVRGLLGCAYGTREYWSVAIWRLLDRVERDWGQRPRKSGRQP
jgi:uncharacterized alpha-E superfamily protein